MARRPPHILVIDDDEVVGRYIALHLRRQTYRVSCVINGAAGEAVIAADAPDVIILDHYLPDTTGEALLDALRQDVSTHDIPVIYLTMERLRARFAGDTTQPDRAGVAAPARLPIIQRAAE